MATTARDGCVVEAAPLAVMVDGFVRDWNRTRPPASSSFAEGGSRRQAPPVGAITWLARETGIPKPTIQNLIRPSGPRYRTVELRIADALVTALGCPEVLADGKWPKNLGGTLEIRPNPLASAEARAQCCGGSEESMNGALPPGTTISRF